MRKIAGIFILAQVAILMTILAAWMPAQVQSGDPPASEPLILTDEHGEYPLGLHLKMLEDPTGELTIDEVSSPDFDSRFIPSLVEVPNYGFTDSVYWVRLTVQNETSLTNYWLLEQGFANTQYVDLYTPLPEGQAYAVKQTGSLRPPATRDISHPRIIFSLTIPPQNQQTIFLRFQNGASMTLPLTLWTQTAFLDNALVEQIAHGIFYGVLIGLLFYNLFLLVSLREASYLYFVILLASSILEEATYDGYLGLYTPPSLYFLNRYFQPLFFSLVIASMVLFSDAFLELKTRLAKFQMINLVILGVWGALLLLTPFVSYHVIASLMAPWALLSLLASFIAGVITWRRGFRSARFFLIAWLGLLTSMVWVILVRLGITPSTFFSENVYRLGYLWMAVCWSIALADRINLLKDEREKASLEVQASEARYRQLVETMNDGLAVTDEEGRFTYVNNRLAQMLGYPVAELNGKLTVGFTADEDNRVALTSQLEARKTGSNQPYELTWRRKDGEEIFTLISPVPLFEDGGRFKGAFAVVTDITERVRARRILEQRVTERTRELSTLLELSHEINTSQELNYLLNRILERLKTIVDYRQSMILVVEEGCWRLGACWPASLEEVSDLFLSVDEARALAQAFEPGKPVLLSNLNDSEALPNSLQKLAIWLSQISLANACSRLGIPLLRKDRLIGLLILDSAGQDGFSDDQLKVVSAFASQAVIVIENGQLLDQVQVTAVAEERNRLAQDLHDSVTQTLFTASVLAEATPRIWDKDQKIARQNMEKLSILIRGALAEMRSLLFELRPSGLRNQTLGQLLTTLAEAARARTRAAISISIKDEISLPENVTLAFYRIAQEALNNGINHAEATQINVSLLEEPDWAELRIQDDGRGFDPRAIAGGHIGISIMSERAAQIGGDLRIRSEPGQGTEIIATWPNRGELT